AAMSILSAQYPRYGYRRIQIFLERQGGYGGRAGRGCAGARWSGERSGRRGRRPGRLLRRGAAAEAQAGERGADERQPATKMASVHGAPKR
ncbi:hypothetical protein ACN4GH_26415, partial [Burkholderia pseudomallei]